MVNKKKLASTDDLVKTLFSKGTTETFQTTANWTRVAIVPVGSNGAIAFLLLDSVPIYQTLEVKWRVFSQPHGSYHMQNNIVVFVWGEPIDQFEAVPAGSDIRA